MTSNVYQQGWQYLNRVYFAQIQALDEEKGQCDVLVLDGLSTVREGLDLPWGGFSMQGQQSSWMRYMPQLRSHKVDGHSTSAGDTVVVGFNVQGACIILGYATYPGTYAEFKNLKKDSPTLIPRGDLNDLKMGEWDMRSSGGAYIYGDTNGGLLLSSGPRTQLRLNKQRNEVKAESGLWVFGSNSSFTRLGDIKRKLLATHLTETDKSLMDIAAPQELWHHLEIPSLTGISKLVYDEQAGGVRDSIGVPYASNNLQPLRYRKKIWSVLSTSIVQDSVFSEEIDALGNHSVAYGPLATNLDIEGGPLQSADISMLSVEVSALTSISTSALTTNSMHAELRATISSSLPIAGVALGSEGALHPIMHGDVYVAVHAPVWAAMITFMTAAATAMPALAKKVKFNPTTEALELAACIAMGTQAAALFPLFANVATAAAAPGALLSAKVLSD